MKLLNAGTAAYTNFAPYSRNCNLGGCRRVYYVPVPALSDVELFINFGVVKPSAVDFKIINLCSPFGNEAITSATFIIAHNGEYWYGVFKNFSGSAYSTYLIAASVTYVDATTQTFFSEQYQNATECDSLTKIEVCYPYNFNAEDLNGIYVGERNVSQTYSGRSSMFYHHSFWVRDAEIIETQNKITFTSNPYKTFASKVNKLYEFRPELVPGWYKDYLLSVYSRGDILINGVKAQVTDLAFENIEEGANLWKAYAVLGKEVKGAFGCAEIDCPDDTLCTPVSLPATTFGNGMDGVPYSKIVAITGTAPFTLSAIVRPAWLTIDVVDSTLVFSGTPATEDIGSSGISFTLTNECGSVDFDSESGITVVESSEGAVNFSWAHSNTIGMLGRFTVTVDGDMVVDTTITEDSGFFNAPVGSVVVVRSESDPTTGTSFVSVYGAYVASNSGLGSAEVTFTVTSTDYYNLVGNSN